MAYIEPLALINRQYQNAATMRFEDIAFLKNGNERQRQAYYILSVHQLLSKLYPFQPIVVGSLPIGVDIPGSALKISCSCQNRSKLKQVLAAEFSQYTDFLLSEKSDKIKASYYIDGLKVEVLGHSLPTHQQLAYRLLLIENYLLRTYGEPLQEQVIAFKLQGMSTETAFARAMGLLGNSHLALLCFEELARQLRHEHPVSLCKP